MRYLLDRVILLVNFSFYHFEYILHLLSGQQIFCSKISFSLMGISLYDICCLSLAAFNICSLCLIFVSLINMCLGIFLLGFILYGTLRASWTWVAISFSMFGKFLTISSSNIFSYPYFFSSSGSPIIWMLVHLVLSQRSLRLFSFLFSLFFFILLCFSYFYHSVCQLTYTLFCLSYSAIGSL